MVNDREAASHNPGEEFPVLSKKKDGIYVKYPYLTKINNPLYLAYDHRTDH